MACFQTIPTVVIDADPAFRQGVKAFLQLCELKSLRFTVVGEATGVDRALALIESYHPTLILLDIELEEGNGIDLLDQLRQSHSPVRSLVISAHQKDELIFRVMQSGAHGYLLKRNLGNHLIKAVTTILDHQVYLPPSIATCFFRQFTAYADEFFPPRPLSGLTEREYEVLQYLIEGYSNQEIARQLYITIATVKAHLTAIYTKLHVGSRAQAIVAALKVGMVSVNGCQIPALARHNVKFN